MTDMLVDVWRLNNKLQQDFTWFQGGSEKRVRLDYFLTSFNVPDITVRVGIEPADNLSDHGTPWIELRKVERKPNFTIKIDSSKGKGKYNFFFSK